nr:unnamed protein product [Digitaria exilis]
MAPAEHAAGTSDEFKKSASSSSLPLLVFQHWSSDNHDGEHEHEHEMLMFSLSQKRLLPAADMEPALVAAGHGGHMCWTTPQGWVLVKSPPDSSSSSSSATSPTWLWNPRTGGKISLPDVEEEHDGIPISCKCLLTYNDVTHPDCFVVLFDYMEPTMWYCKVTAGDGRRRGWRRYTYDVGEYEVPPRTPTKDVVSSIAAVQGELFFIDSAREMCAITLSSACDDDPEFLYFDVSMVRFPGGMCSGRTWLVESDDELFLVCVCFVGFDADNIGAVNVHRMDFSTEAWCRVHDVGDVVFLLEDANMGASCPASPLGLKPNQVYFIKNFMADDGDLCVFDIGLEIQEITQVHQHDDLPLYRKPFRILPPSMLAE